MSRCFPFPPPGYEKKTRTDDTDLLKKEKHREKKHKKEKDNDQEKREGKEKREKDKSDGKHRDKKDKKEKHREKKKDKEKERDKDKDKISNPVEKRIDGQSQSYNGEKLNQKEKEQDKDQYNFSDGKKQTLQLQGHSGEKPIRNSLLSQSYNGEKLNQKEKERDKDKNNISDGKKQTLQLQGHSGEKPIRNSLLSESYNGERLNQKEKERDKDKNHISDGKKQTLQLQGHSGEKPIGNSLLSARTGDTKFVQELGRRTGDEEKCTGSQLVERFPGTDWKNERMDGVVVKDAGILAGGKEINKEKIVDNRKINGQGIGGDARSSGSAVVQNLSGMVQNRVEGMQRPLEKNIERRMEDKEESKEREGDDNKGGVKRKDKNREKKSHGKDKDREKEKKKEKVKENSVHKNQDEDRFKDSNKNDHVVTQNIKTSHVAKDGDRNTATEGNLKKRKDPEANGILHGTVVRPNKRPRPSSHPSTENGKKLESCQTPILFTSDRQQGPPNNLKVDNKECRVNGVIETQPLSISSKKSSSASAQADQIAKASMKPPHPDSKYLSQVLSVPRVEEWSDFDDQEWLFSSKGRSEEKLDVHSAGLTETQWVWAEALQIESADVCALPYVIPY